MELYKTLKNEARELIQEKQYYRKGPTDMPPEPFRLMGVQIIQGTRTTHWPERKENIRDNENE